MSRRKFMKLMAASMALAGIGLTGCRRWPKEKLAPQTSNVEGPHPGPQRALRDRDGARRRRARAARHQLRRPADQDRGEPAAPVRADVNEQLRLGGRVTRRRACWSCTTRTAAARRSSATATMAERSTWDDFRRAMPKLFAGDGGGVAVLSEACSGPTSPTCGSGS